MMTDEANTEEKIFQAAMSLITAGKNEQQITMREIASLAGVNLALVNYHYKSKENLLSQVVGTMMGGIINRISENDQAEKNATEKLKSILMATADAAFQYPNICKIAVSHELKAGCRNSCEMVLPLLREIFEARSESELRIIALQLMMPFHHIVLEPERYNQYLGTDFFNAQKRKEAINQMVDCVLSGQKRR